MISLVLPPILQTPPLLYVFIRIRKDEYDSIQFGFHHVISDFPSLFV